MSLVYQSQYITYFKSSLGHVLYRILFFQSKIIQFGLVQDSLHQIENGVSYSKDIVEQN